MHFFKTFLPLAFVAALVFAAPAPVGGVEESSIDDVKHSPRLEALVASLSKNRQSIVLLGFSVHP